MGASGWQYKVPFDPDVDAALRRLREEVFAAGTYAKPLEGLDGFPAELLAQDLVEMAEMTGEEIDPASIERLVAGDDPISIDEALMWSAESGTHSILDMVVGIRDEPDFGVITRLSPEACAEHFGTEHPTESAVEAALGELDALVTERWQGLYVIAYTDDQPSSIFFVGTSGD